MVDTLTKKGISVEQLSLPLNWLCRTPIDVFSIYIMVTSNYITSRFYSNKLWLFRTLHIWDLIHKALINYCFQFILLLVKSCAIVVDVSRGLLSTTLHSKLHPDSRCLSRSSITPLRVLISPTVNVASSQTVMLITTMILCSWSVCM
jgi:hypothetical protein